MRIPEGVCTHLNKLPDASGATGWHLNASVSAVVTPSRIFFSDVMSFLSYPKDTDDEDAVDMT